MSSPSSHSHGCGCGGGQPAAVEPAPDWIHTADHGAARMLDVRPVLASGGEPFSLIMTAAGQVPEGGVLVLDAPFDPVPLKKVLGGQGFESYSRPLAADHWRAYFRRQPRPATAAAGDATAGRVWREGSELHIDVRGLPPPQPMLAILRLIDGDAALAGLVVHHEREPLFLYPELAERGWTYSHLAGDPGEVRLRLARSSP